MRLIIESVLFLIGLAAMAVLLVLAWRKAISDRRQRHLARWRSGFEIAGLLFVTTAYIAYLGAFTHAGLMNRGMVTKIDVIAAYGTVKPHSDALLGVVLGVFGKGLPRAGAIVIGVVTVMLWLWYAGCGTQR